MVAANLGLIRTTLKQTTAGQGLARDDRYQVACLALMAAVRGFDPACGTAFSTYFRPILHRALARPQCRDRLVRLPDKMAFGAVDDVADGAPDTAESAAQRVDHADLLGQLKLAAAGLDDRARLILALRLRGAKHAAVGAALGVSGARARQLEVAAHGELKALVAVAP